MKTTLSTGLNASLLQEQAAVITVSQTASVLRSSITNYFRKVIYVHSVLDCDIAALVNHIRTTFRKDELEKFVCYTLLAFRLADCSIGCLIQKGRYYFSETLCSVRRYRWTTYSLSSNHEPSPCNRRMVCSRCRIHPSLSANMAMPICEPMISGI